MNIDPELIRRIIAVKMFFDKQWATVPLYSKPTKSRHSSVLEEMLDNMDDEQYSDVAKTA